MHNGLTIYTTFIGAVRKEKDDCRRIRWLFTGLKLQFHEVDVGETRFVRKKLCELSNTTSLPQAFIGEIFVGTYDDIEVMNDDGVLLQKLKELGYEEVSNFVAESPYDAYEDEEPQEQIVPRSRQLPHEGGEEEEEDDWAEYYADDGEAYYHNHKTGETTWDKPVDFGAPSPKEEDNSSKKQEEAKLKTEAEEKLKTEAEEKRKKEEQQEKLKKEEAEKQKQQREKEEQEKLKKEEDEKRKQEEERVKREEEEKKQKQEEDRLKREEAEKQKQEEERRNKEAEEKAREEKEKAAKEEAERQQKEVEAKAKQEEEERRTREEEERKREAEAKSEAEQQRRAQEEAEEVERKRIAEEQEKQRQAEEEQARKDVEQKRRDEAEQQERALEEQRRQYTGPGSPYAASSSTHGTSPPLYTTNTNTRDDNITPPNTSFTSCTRYEQQGYGSNYGSRPTRSAYGAIRRDPLHPPHTIGSTSPSSPHSPWGRSTNSSQSSTSSLVVVDHNAPAGALKVWIDTDIAAGIPGCEIDDALAIVYCLKNPDIQVLGISCTYGNTCVEEVFRIATDLVHRFAPNSNIPIVSGATNCTDLGKPSEAISALKYTMDQCEGEPVTLLCLGPATNIATFSMLHPTMMSRRIQKVILCAGIRDTHEMKWPLTEMPDYNFECDWMAVAILLKTGIPLYYIPLEAAGSIWWAQKDLEPFQDDKSETSQYLYNLCSTWLEFWRKQFKVDSFICRDVLAATAVLKAGTAFNSTTLYTWVQQRAGAYNLQQPKPCLVATANAATTAVRPRTCVFCHTPHHHLKAHIVETLTSGS